MRSRGRTRPAIALGCTSCTAPRKGRLRAERNRGNQDHQCRATADAARCRYLLSDPPVGFIVHPLVGGAGHYLDSAVALATLLVDIIALGPFSAEPARLDPVGRDAGPNQRLPNIADPLPAQDPPRTRTWGVARGHERLVGGRRARSAESGGDAIRARLLRSARRFRCWRTPLP